MTDKTITKEIKGKVFEINLNNPKQLNALTLQQFSRIAELLIEADNHPETTITLLTSSGNYFSAGANIKDVSKLVNQNSQFYFNEITSKNIYLISLLSYHKKLLVCGLNGPAFGLSASFVSLFDLIYARDPGNPKAEPFFSFPFTNASMINEGAISSSFVYRVGLSKALEVICLGKKFTLSDMVRSGLVNEVFKFEDVGEFNAFLEKYLNEELAGLDPLSIFENKKLIRSKFNEFVKVLAMDESIQGLEKWVANKPQTAFKEILEGKRKHKL